MKVNNFSAGPSKIPDTVVNQISKDILDYQKLGYSVLEISHRSKVFEEILAKVKSHLYELLKIPDNFDIFFLQGGATFQNTFIPANKPSLIDNLLFLISGTWGKKTYQDFERYHNQNLSSISLNDETYDELKTKIYKKDEKYLYITSNETIEGLQIRNFNNFEDKELIIDMSSDICSYVFDWKNISYVYAGAQNNLTSYINAHNHIDKDSSFNTPPTFSIYVMLKVLEWLTDSGGLEKIQSDNSIKAESLYKFLDDNSDKFNMSVPKEFRSYSNIVFDFKDSKITTNFLNSSIDKGFLGLNGHRSVGGVRVSNYNSISNDMMNNLITHLKGFV